MAYLYLAVMVELLATIADVTYVTGYTTNTLPLLSTTALVSSCLVSRLRYEMIAHKHNYTHNITFRSKA